MNKLSIDDVRPATPVIPAEPDHESYRRIEPELDAAQTTGVIIHLEVIEATNMVLAALPALQALRASILAELPSFSIELLDKLGDYARALRYAQLTCDRRSDREANVLGVGRAARGGTIPAHQLKVRKLRCYALFMDAYRECRAAVAWVRRRQGDANAILPSLHAGGGRKSGRYPRVEEERSAVETAETSKR